MLIFYKFIDFTPQNQIIHINPSKISQPLIIDNNWDDLVNGGICSGSGTYNDPYIIQDYTINGGGAASCIEIRNSNKFFKILNCTLTNSQDFVNPYRRAGILLINVTNGMILDVESSANLGNGISLYDCRNITIRSSGFNNNNREGIYFYNSHNNTVFGNLITDNTYNGISLYICNTTRLVQNYVFNNHRGIYLMYCHKDLILNNSVLYNDWFGIYVWLSEQIFLSENIIKSNGKADGPGGAGMQLRHSRDCIITNNYFFNNSVFGLDLAETSVYNKVYFNKFIDNDLNAVDDCLHNRWDDGVIGNYWDDYEILYVPPATNDGFIWNIPYEISGAANSEDNNPLYIFLEDLYPPIIEFEITDEYLNTTTPLETDKTLQIICSILDYSRIDWVYLCENSTGLFQNHSMYSDVNSKWTYDLDISIMERGRYVSFSFYALDSHRNLGINNNGNLNFTIRIGDYTPPVINFEISNDFLNTTAPFETEKKIQINCSVSDYSSIEWVYLCENTTGIFQNHSMSKGLNGDWTYNLDLSLLNEGDNFEFFFYAKDLYSNIGINNNNGNNFTIFYGDSDNDGMPNGWEILYNLNPLLDDSSNDNDVDFLLNLEEFEYKTNPIDSDSDNDSLLDGEEVNTYSTDPNDSDTDNDLYSDRNEVLMGTNPLDINDPGIWENDPFIIDVNGGGNYTWFELSSLPWFSGSGTPNNPFIIKNLIIDANKSKSCLEIKNSNKFFKIINCNFSNAEFGIKLYEVSNGILSNNKINQLSGNNGLDGISHFHDGEDGTPSFGIFASKINNITFVNNKISHIKGGNGGHGGNDGDGGTGGKGYGIYLLNSWDNMISLNEINNINAGQAGSILTGDGRGSDGSNSYGIYIKNVSNTHIKSNIIRDIGGSNGAYTRSYDGGDGGSGFGIWAKKIKDNIVFNNSFTNIYGGDGGSSYLEEEGCGGHGFGIYICNSLNNNFTFNTFNWLSSGVGDYNGITVGIALVISSYNNISTNTLRDLDLCIQESIKCAINTIVDNNCTNISNYIEGRDYDRDGLLDVEEIYFYLTNYKDSDTDDDGLPDGWEIYNLLDPLINDSLIDPDKDNLTNLEEYQYNTEPFNNDTDIDNLLDGEEVHIYNTNPLSQDSDTDGLIDGEEVLIYNTNPLSPDTDSDNLLDGEEVHTYNTNPLSPDTDLDGLPDRWEVENGLNPLVHDANEDSDGDGLTNSMEYNCNTNPRDPDTDNDGLSDGEEINTYLTHPNDSDTDNDGLSDGEEISTYLTDPNDSDTDNDGYSDGEEISAGTDPNDPNSNPLSPYIIGLIFLFGISALIILNLIFYGLSKRLKLKR